MTLTRSAVLVDGHRAPVSLRWAETRRSTASSTPRQRARSATRLPSVAMLGEIDESLRHDYGVVFESRARRAGCRTTQAWRKAVRYAMVRSWCHVEVSSTVLDLRQASHVVRGTGSSAAMRDDAAPPNKRMKLTKLSAARLPGWTCRLMPAPAGLDAGTASQLIRGVRPTLRPRSDLARIWPECGSRSSWRLRPIEQYRSLPAHVRSRVRDALETHLRHEPTEGQPESYQAASRAGTSAVPVASGRDQGVL